MENNKFVHSIGTLPNNDEHILEKLIQEGEWSIPEKHIRHYFRAEPDFCNNVVNNYKDLDALTNIKHNTIEQLVSIKSRCMQEFKKEMYESLDSFVSVAIERFVKKKDSVKKIIEIKKHCLSYIEMYKFQEIDKLKLLIIAHKAFTKDEIDKLCENAYKSFEHNIENLFQDCIKTILSIND